MLRFEGRGYPSPNYKVNILDNGIEIRIDDDLNPESWGNLFISYDLLCSFLQMIGERAAASLPPIPLPLDQLPDDDLGDDLADLPPLDE